MYYFNNPEKSTFNYVMGVTLDPLEYFRDYHLTQKGKLLWDQIYMLKWYAQDLCLRYYFTCCSTMNAPHLPFPCKFNDNETLASYAKGIYDYYDVERIEEFVAFMGAYEIESLFKECENLDDAVYRPEILLYLNIAMRIMNSIPILMILLRESPLSKKRLIFCRKLWKNKLMIL